MPPSVSGPSIPRNNHADFHYFAFKLTSSDAIKPDLRLSRRAALHARAHEVAFTLDMHFLGHVGELEDYFQVAVPKPSAAILVRRQTGSVLDEAVDDQIEQILANQDAIDWAQTQLPKAPYHKRGVIPESRHRWDVVNARTSVDSNVLGSRAAFAAKQFGILDPMFGSQWHLINDIPGQVGNDHNVTGAWEQGIFGNGTIVCLVDDGLDYTALDLKDNYFAEGSYDFNAHTPDPLPKLALDRHGTRCAGEIAASTNNICGVGLAFKARVSAVRTLGEKITHADEAAAINYKFHENHIYSCSWGPSDSGYVMEAPAPLIQAALENGVQNGRRGLGSIYVFAAGNGGFYADNCNYDGFTNSIYTITVAAVTRNNEHPMYSESCSAVLVSMYSSSDDVKNDAIVTTDWAPSNSADGTLCTQEHGKTSAAAPLASAVYALVHSIRPDLTWRDFQHISVNSAVPFKTEGISWFRTHAGRWYSPEFGYGKLDAYAILEFAKTWRTVPPHVSIRTGLRQPVGDGSIPPRNENDSTILFDVTAEMLQSVSFGRLEYVQITVYIKHTRRGDVLVRLVSPNGVVSRLAVYRPDDKARSGFPGWTFSSVAHWDESPLGTWAVIADDKANHMSNGTFLDASLTFWGSKFDPTFQFVPAPLPVLIPTNVNVSVHGESAPEEWMWIYGGLGAFMLVGVLYALFIRRRRNATAGKQDMFTRLK